MLMAESGNTYGLNFSNSSRYKEIKQRLTGGAPQQCTPNIDRYVKDMKFKISSCTWGQIVMRKKQFCRPKELATNFSVSFKTSKFLCRLIS